MDKTLSAIIVTFNRLQKLKVTINKTCKERFDQIVIVDNYSNDGTKEWLDSLQDARLHIIHLEENIGGAGGFHVGFKYVVENTLSDWLVCYDDDAYPKHGLVEKFIELSFASDVSSVAASVFLTNGDISPMNRPRYNIFKHKKQYVEDSDYKSIIPIDIDMSSFVGYFIRTNLIKEYNHYPQKELFIYADDLIYSLYWTNVGYSHLFVSELEFIHDTDTLHGDQGKYHPLWKVYYTFRNGIELYRHMSKWSVVPFIIAKYIQLYFQKQYYPKERQKSYQTLINMAAKDGLQKDFSRTFEQIKNI